MIALQHEFTSTSSLLVPDEVREGLSSLLEYGKASSQGTTVPEKLEGESCFPADSVQVEGFPLLLVLFSYKTQTGKR